LRFSYLSLALLFVGILTLTRSYPPRDDGETTLSRSFNATPVPSDPGLVDRFDVSNYVLGPPTLSFRDNLRSDVKYITSWLGAGWTNDVMTYGNLIYLGLITGRVPVLGMFNPSHGDWDLDPIPFSEVFDIPRLSRAINLPIIEWLDVKNFTSPDAELDAIGCWSVWQSSQFHDPDPRGSYSADQVLLDISYTKSPAWIKLIPNYEHDNHVSFWSLASLSFPETRLLALRGTTPTPSEERHVYLPPDEQLLCYDYLYYACTNQPTEYEFDYGAAWAHVVQHLHWREELEHIAEAVVRRTIGVEAGQPTPPWITIHVRHDDFLDYCGDFSPEECFAPLPTIARRVKEVQEELLWRKGLVVSHVFVTSDEKDLKWWADVNSMGWYRIDHSRTAQLFGGWYPLLIDAVIQSNGMGFVGNDLSTMSTLARRRVDTWHGGATRIVMWGEPNADDHESPT